MKRVLLKFQSNIFQVENILTLISLKLMDKRIEQGNLKYIEAHREITNICNELLKTLSFSKITFNEISKYSNYSKTTIYEHFDSDINLLFKNCLEYFRNSFLSSLILTDDYKKNILHIYKKFFNFGINNSLYFKNLHMIAVNLNTLDNPQYQYKSIISETLLENFRLHNAKLDGVTYWALATNILLQVGDSFFDINKEKQHFFYILMKDLKK